MSQDNIENKIENSEQTDDENADPVFTMEVDKLLSNESLKSD